MYAFLTQLSVHYEIVVFTAANKDYAEYFVKKIDRTNVIKYLLHRDHCTIDEDGRLAKDIRLLGRELSKVIIVDNCEDNFRLSAENGILVPDFTDDFED